MAQRRLISHDPITGLNTWHDYDSLTDTTTISYTGEHEGIIERNKEIANDVDVSRKGMKNDFLYYASIPATVQVDWLINKGVDVMEKHHAKEMFKLLNDPEYKHLKVTTKNHRPK